MRHLSPEDLLDAAEGTRAPGEFPHLAECDACRRQLDDLRQAISAVDVDVPEPSPLFWDHLSARVREVVAAEPQPSTAWWRSWTPWRFGAASAALAAAVLLAVALGHRTTPAGSVPVPPVPVVSAPAPGIAAVDDPSLTFVADLAEGVDWDAASRAGFTASAAAVDGALQDLTPEESAELQRLLNEALSRPPNESGV
jgi:hypothetical protein